MKMRLFTMFRIFFGAAFACSLLLVSTQSLAVDPCTQPFVEIPGTQGVLTDADSDGVPDSNDNCPNVKNGNCDVADACCYVDRDLVVSDAEYEGGFQADTDFDNIGDVCDDSDNDGHMDYIDTCPDIADQTNRDSNGDRIGDACTDTDRDGVLDPIDNCKDVENALQRDTDEDGFGDACDKCILIPDPLQQDSDGDRTGDACEPGAPSISPGQPNIRRPVADAVANPNPADHLHVQGAGGCSLSIVRSHSEVPNPWLFVMLVGIGCGFFFIRFKIADVG